MTRDRHARRATFACVRCKRDKRRCDISQATGDDPDGPRCTTCRNRNEHCEVRYGDDKRTNRQTQDSKALYRRIAALEDVIKNISDSKSANERPCSDQSNSQPDPQHVLEPSADAQSQTQSAFLSPANSSSSNAPAGSQTPTSPEKRAEAFVSVTYPNEISTSDSTRSVSSSSQPSSSVQDITDCFPSGMDEVTAPAASFRGQRQRRNSQYFGSPNLFPYSERTYGSKEVGDHREGITPEEDANRRSRAALEASPEPEPIIVHLLDLFWKWQACHLLVIDRDIFLHHRKIWDESGGNGDRNFYTPCLLYAILSMASLISPDAGVRKYSAPPTGIAGENFAKRSRALFELEMEHPTLTTVQTALILGSRYGAMVDNSLGWTYSGTSRKF